MRQQQELLLMKYCKDCRSRTPHTEHGFKYHNYRISCCECLKETWVQEILPEFLTLASYESSSNEGAPFE